MIQKHSEDPDVGAAAARAADIIRTVLSGLPKAETFDYGGHILKLGEYGVCTQCTSAIAEAQAAHAALLERIEAETDPVVQEHLDLAAQLLQAEAQAAIVRAELHNGQGSEQIVNILLGFTYDRHVHDSYGHSHNGGK